MRIDFKNWEHRNLNGNKLPTEADLKHFFSCFLLEEKSTKKGFFHLPIGFDYVGCGDLARHSRSQRYPIIGENATWLTPSLTPLDSKIKLSSKGKPLIDLETNKENPEETQESNRHLPPIAFSLGTEIAEEIQWANPQTSTSREWTIKKFRDLNSIVYDVNSFITKFISYESESFRESLNERGYIQGSTESEILEKIKIIRLAYPVEPIFIMAEMKLLDYLNAYSLGPKEERSGKIAPGAYLIADNYSSYGSSSENRFSDYHSAVFTINSMSGKSEFKLHYALQRENRQWKIYLAIIGKLGFQIPTNPLKEGISELPKEHHHSRWNQLL
jgi:hypothetical protein